MSNGPDWDYDKQNISFLYAVIFLSYLGGNNISELRKHICCSFYCFIDMRGLKWTNIQYCIKGNILIDISLFYLRTFYALPSILFLVVGFVLIIQACFPLQTPDLIKHKLCMIDQLRYTGSSWFWYWLYSNYADTSNLVQIAKATMSTYMY
jgi:hypothetical protein